MLNVLCGFSKSGKDEIGKHLPGIRLAFADPMKELFCIAAGIGLDVLEANKDRYRNQLVAFGRAGRNADPEIWINPVRRKAELWIGVPFDIGVKPWGKVTDCRYLNEAEIMQSLGARLFYIERDGVGPANDEERDSIAKLRRVLSPPTIHNPEGHPEHAAAAILEAMKEQV